MDGVELSFTPEAMEAVAEFALKRKIGARGLRSILETSMLDVMFEIPSMEGVSEVIIGREVIEGKAEPVVVFDKKAEAG